MDSGRLGGFGEVLTKRPLGQLILGYVVGGWALVDVLANLSELAGLPLTLARWALVLLAVGLLPLLALALFLRTKTRARESSSPKRSGRREALLISALVAALLPMSLVFSVDENSVRWLMWRDAPFLAGVCLVLSVVFVIAWRRSGVHPSPAEDSPGAGATQSDPGPAL